MFARPPEAEIQWARRYETTSGAHLVKRADIGRSIIVDNGDPLPAAECLDRMSVLRRTTPGRYLRLNRFQDRYEI